MQVRLALFTLFVAREDVRGCFQTSELTLNHLYSIHTDSDMSDLPESAPLPITSLVCGDGGGGGDDSSPVYTYSAPKEKSKTSNFGNF